MERLHIEGTKMTPEVILDSAQNIYSITGNSRPENPMQFYKPIFEWFNERLNQLETRIIVEVKMDYFNTSTSKIFLDLFELFEDMISKNTYTLFGIIKVTMKRCKKQEKNY